MTDATTILLPLPRIVTGERVGAARDGREERVCQLDPVPVPVRAVPAGEAPEVLRLTKGHRRWHAHGGRLYAPLFREEGGTADPARVAEVMAARAGESFPGMSGAATQKGETVIDYRDRFMHASRSLGLKGPEGHRMRKVSDDGCAARDAEAARLSAKLLLVGDELMHPIPMPFYRLETGRRRSPAGAWESALRVVAHAPYEHRFQKASEIMNNPPRCYETGAAPDAEHLPWEVFEPWRESEAREFAAALAAQGHDGAVRLSADEAESFEVVDRAALEAAVGDRGLAHYARAASARYLRMGLDLYARPDAVLTALMAHRADVAALGAGGSPEAAMESLRAYADAFAASERDPGESRIAMAGLGMMARYDEYERPRAGLEPLRSADMAELAGLAP